MKKGLISIAAIMFSYIPFLDKVDYVLEGEVLEVKNNITSISYIWMPTENFGIIENKSLYVFPELRFLKKGDIITETAISKQSLFGKGLELLIGETSEIFIQPQKFEYKIREKNLNDYSREKNI